MTKWKMSRWLWPVILACAFWASPSWAQRFTAEFDHQFQESAKRWMPYLPSWRLIKAQCYQESRLNPLAVSPAGAKGLCQFMSATLSDVSRAMKWGAQASAFDPAISIEAAAYYMNRLHQTWRRDRSVMERHWLAIPSYNAGTGHILSAQRACNEARLWDDIAPCLVQVTGPDNSRETLGYVVNIKKWYRQMEIGQ